MINIFDAINTLQLDYLNIFSNFLNDCETFLNSSIGLLLIMCGDIELNPGPKMKFLNFCHVNIRSLSRSKLLALQTHLANFYDVITLSETHLHPGLPKDVFNLKGFHEIIRKDRPGLGGGVAVYVKENIAFKRIFEL